MEGLNFADLITQLGLGGGILYVAYKLITRLLKQLEKKDEKISGSISDMHGSVKKQIDIAEASDQKLTTLVELHEERNQ